MKIQGKSLTQDKGVLQKVSYEQKKIVKISNAGQWVLQKVNLWETFRKKIVATPLHIEGRRSKQFLPPYKLS